MLTMNSVDMRRAVAGRYVVPPLAVARDLAISTRLPPVGVHLRRNRHRSSAETSKERQMPEPSRLEQPVKERPPSLKRRRVGRGGGGVRPFPTREVDHCQNRAGRAGYTNRTRPFDFGVHCTYTRPQSLRRATAK